MSFDPSGHEPTHQLAMPWTEVAGANDKGILSCHIDR